MLAYLFAAIVLLGFPATSCAISEPAKAMDTSSSKDQVALEHYLRWMLEHSQGSAVLFGQKPICAEAILLKLPGNLSLGSPYIQSSFCFRRGYEASQQLGLDNPNNRIVVCLAKEPTPPGEQWRDILWINQDAFLRVVNDNLQMFQYALGPQVTAEQLLHRLTVERENLHSVFQGNNTLIGIVLGFGTENAILGSREEAIDKALIQEESSPLKHRRSRIVSITKAQGQAFPRGFYLPMDHGELLPRYPHRTLADEYSWLKNHMKFSRNLPCAEGYNIPWFGCIPDSQETKALLADYIAADEQAQTLLQSNDFLPKLLKAFKGDTDN